MMYQCNSCGAQWSIPGKVFLDCPFCFAGANARLTQDMLARAAMRHNEEQLKRSILATPDGEAKP
jgi:hypothetical protein